MSGDCVVEVVVDEKLVGVEHVVVVDVADAADGVADDLVDVDHVVDRLLADFGMVISPPTTTMLLFTKVSQATRLFGSIGEAGVEDGVGNGVADLVWMAFADGFGGKNVGAHGVFLIFVSSNRDALMYCYSDLRCRQC